MKKFNYVIRKAVLISTRVKKIVPTGMNDHKFYHRNHAIQKPKNLIWPPGSHLENEVTENQ